MIAGEQNGRLGRVFVNFGRPIDVKTYLQKVDMSKVAHDNIDSVALRLSEKLYKEQQHMSTTNLSWLVAALLLQEQGQKVSLKQLTSNCIKLYDYLKKRKVTSVIMAEPTEFAVEKVVKKLGFKLKK
jgi:glycerol-3-phosphate O-acyltransferase